MPTLAEVGRMPTLAEVGRMPTLAEVGRMPTLAEVGRMPTLADRMYAAATPGLSHQCSVHRRMSLTPALIM